MFGVPEKQRYGIGAKLLKKMGSAVSWFGLAFHMRVTRPISEASSKKVKPMLKPMLHIEST